MEKKQLLIVDSDDKHRSLLRELLEVEGYDVTAVANVKDAVNKYIAYFFDLVLSDAYLTEFSGIDLLRELKKIDNDVLVVLFSESADSRDNYKQMIHYGVCDLVDKPFNMSELIKIIEHGLEKRAFVQKIRSYHEGLEAIVEERTETLKLQKEALEKEQQRTQRIIQEAHIGFLILDGESQEIFMLNKKGEELFALNEEAKDSYFLKNYEQVLNKKIRDSIKLLLKSVLKEKKFVNFGQFEGLNGRILNMVGYPIIINKDINSIAIVAEDITERIILEKQLLQSSRLAGLGELAAGVAHEINNPIAFVSNNNYMMQEYFSRLYKVLQEYDSLDTVCLQEKLPEIIKNKLSVIISIKEDFKIAKVLKNIEEIMRENSDGLNRVKKIVMDLKSFSYMGEEKPQAVDLNQIMDDTLNLVWNEIKYKAEVVRNFGDIPKIACFPVQISQVFANILVNAAHAILEKGMISITTLAEADVVKISIVDTGRGIDAAVLGKIFDPFFTTKVAGEGTGLGLSIAYKIIDKHHGNIAVKSKVGKGTSFEVTLPVQKIKD